MKNILHMVVTSRLSGAEKIALLICRSLHENYNVTFVCGGDELNNVAREYNINSEIIDFNSNIPKILFGLKRIIKERNIHIVHAHDNRASLYAYLVKKIFLLDITIISHIHNCYPWLEYVSIYKLIDMLVRNRFDASITCGSVVNDYYLKNAKYAKRKKIYSISNFIDVAEIDASQKKEEINDILKKFNIDKSKTIFGFIGRLSEQKGLVPFINELAKYKSKFKDCIFLLVGSGEQEQHIRELINKLDMEEMFILTGYQKNVYSYYSIIDIFFLPSIYEGLPMVLLEAMALGKAIVSMNVGGISELIINEKNGILIESGNYNKFIEHLYHLKNDRKKIEKFQENSKAYVKEKFDVRTQIPKIERLYREVAK
ncbi:glycosyltransferase [Saccharococcus caldoxylosilyticus]|uniref:Putative glycosyltransferase n=1 Tax=Parageobacillus caldoxylosilyticus NBRC 107762 TaxID=1220594 RepID=A0A023DB64_9BACL|nr:glycosyltransferase [Parageobacillus caldoxylosilyticus]MBB3851072.1 glycosyltransferase involved in cell wall biosynthesis [Parageobacillus caldoxylosilyticus]GAJ38352.1 putative glycosyltransferase [Parageobacillus caldoxylosilyticus NBRC 107762]